MRMHEFPLKMVLSGRKCVIFGREKWYFFREKVRDLQAKSGIFRVEIHDFGVTN